MVYLIRSGNQEPKRENPINHANYGIINPQATSILVGENILLIKDLGPWDLYPTVTNDANYVVEELVWCGHLREGQRLFYYDSDGSVDELLVKNGKFAGFAPGPSTLSKR